ncbi:hypothetical protein IFM47457_02447 [Aspergillus lentulus]|nr:hypothetical protein IFM47457_02447 [Aspergillus lentulus]
MYAERSQTSPSTASSRKDSEKRHPATAGNEREVHPAIEGATALISAAETTNPVIDRTILPSRQLAFKLLVL